MKPVKKSQSVNPEIRESEERLRVFLERVRSRPKRELVTEKMPNGGFRVAKVPVRPSFLKKP